MCGKWSRKGTRLHFECEADIRIITLRLIYFFQTTAASSISRFLIVFLDKYFNAQQLGLLIGIRKSTTFFASFIWGFIGDWTGRHLTCLIGGLIIATVIINGYLFPMIGQHFWYAFALSNAAAFFGASGTLFDAIVLLILGEDRAKKENSDESKQSDSDSGTKKYGATRMWGAIGWAMGSMICGTLLAELGEDYLFIFYDINYSIPITIMILSASLLKHKKQEKEHKHSEDDSSDTLSTAAMKRLDTKLFRNNVFTSYGVIFLVNLLLFGTCMAFVEQYLFLFLLQYFNATTVLCGLTIGMMVAGEVPIFYWSTWFIDKCGIIGLLSLAHFAYVIRCVGYTILPQTRYYSWFILIIEPLHGLTFGGMWIASVEYGSKLAPKSMQGTMQGLIAGIYQGLASCCGTVIGGVLYHHFGPVWMYRMSACVVGGWMVLFQISLRTIRLCNDSEGIRLLFGEKIQREDVKEKLIASKASLGQAVAAPERSLLINGDD